MTRAARVARLYVAESEVDESVCSGSCRSWQTRSRRRRGVLALGHFPDRATLFREWNERTSTITRRSNYNVVTASRPRSRHAASMSLDTLSIACNLAVA